MALHVHIEREPRKGFEIKPLHLDDLTSEIPKGGGMRESFKSIAKGAGSEEYTITFGTRIRGKILESSLDFLEEWTEFVDTNGRHNSKEIDGDTMVSNEVILVQVPPHNGQRILRGGRATKNKSEVGEGFGE